MVILQAAGSRPLERECRCPATGGAWGAGARDGRGEEGLMEQQEYEGQAALRRAEAQALGRDTKELYAGMFVTL